MVPTTNCTGSFRKDKYGYITIDTAYPNFGKNDYTIPLLVDFSQESLQNLQKFNISIRDISKRHVFKTAKSAYIFFNSKNKYPIVGKGSQKKAVFCLKNNGEVKLVTIMNNNDNSKRQTSIQHKIKESIEEQKRNGVTNPILEQIIVKVDEDGIIEYTNKKGQKKVAIVQEFMNGGDLFNGIIKKSFTAEDAVEIIPSILEGLCKLHKIGIYVRDIKEGNFLWGRDPETDKVVVKMNDFDLSCFSNSEKQERRTRYGTYSYGCWEYLAGMMEDHLDKQDIWATAMVLYKLVTNFDLPWRAKAHQIRQTYAALKPKNEKERLQNCDERFSKLQELISTYSGKIKQWFPPELKAHPMGDLIYLMLSPYFKNRPDANEIWDKCQKILKNPEHLNSFKKLYDQFHP